MDPRLHRLFKIAGSSRHGILTENLLRAYAELGEYAEHRGDCFYNREHWINEHCPEPAWVCTCGLGDAQAKIERILEEI